VPGQALEREQPVQPQFPRAEKVGAPAEVGPRAVLGPGCQGRLTTGSRFRRQAESGLRHGPNRARRAAGARYRAGRRGRDTAGLPGSAARLGAEGGTRLGWTAVGADTAAGADATSGVAAEPVTLGDATAAVWLDVAAAVLAALWAANTVRRAGVSTSASSFC